MRRFYGAIWIRWHHDMERCGLCGRGRTHIADVADRTRMGAGEDRWVDLRSRVEDAVGELGESLVS